MDGIWPTLAAAAGAAYGLEWFTSARLALEFARVMVKDANLPRDRAFKDSETMYLNAVTRAFTTTALGITRMRPEAPIRSTRFTLAELATTIESIATQREMPEEHVIDLEQQVVTSETHQFQREEIVWNWLKQLGGDVWSWLFNKLQDMPESDNAGDVPTADTSQMVANDQYTVKLHIRITIDDALGCAAEPSYHEIHCEREDVCLLANAAAGTLDDMARLFRAIANLVEVLDMAIESPKRAGNSWVDWAYYNGRFAMDHLNAQLAQRRAGDLTSIAPLTWKALRAIELNVSDPMGEQRLGQLKAVRDG